MACKKLAPLRSSRGIAAASANKGAVAVPSSSSCSSNTSSSTTTAFWSTQRENTASTVCLLLASLLGVFSNSQHQSAECAKRGCLHKKNKKNHIENHLDQLEPDSPLLPNRDRQMQLLQLELFLESFSAKAKVEKVKKIIIKKKVNKKCEMVLPKCSKINK